MEGSRIWQAISMKNATTVSATATVPEHPTAVAWIVPSPGVVMESRTPLSNATTGATTPTLPAPADQTADCLLAVITFLTPTSNAMMETF